MDEERNNGIAWHMFHNYLLSWSGDYKWRIHEITSNKPKSEIPTRLRLFKLVEGKLPDEFDGVTTDSQITRLVDKHKYTIMRLHKKECPNCSWNGYEIIFPNLIKRIWQKLFRG